MEDELPSISIDSAMKTSAILKFKEDVIGLFSKKN